MQDTALINIIAGVLFIPILLFWLADSRGILCRLLHKIIWSWVFASAVSDFVYTAIKPAWEMEVFRRLIYQVSVGDCWPWFPGGVNGDMLLNTRNKLKIACHCTWAKSKDMKCILEPRGADNG